MVSSLRAFGYDLAMAIADLIDNSLFARAKTIEILYSWNDGLPWFAVKDDGRGMSEERLHEAMRLGSQGPLLERDASDLGRFGLGLKTASFSQGRLLTVLTRPGEHQTHARHWDLDHVCETGLWELGLGPAPEAIPVLRSVCAPPRGTIVVCQKLDRLGVQQDEDGGESDLKAAFLHSFGRVAEYLEVVYHRFLTGSGSVRILVGRHECRPWDPFLTGNRFTQTLSQEALGAPPVVVRPFVLPHVSKRSDSETSSGGGLKGWNAQQGFYVYRNNRVIIAGGYLDLPFKPEEHYKLCRIAIDIPNSLDHEWGIDVRKAVASPPSSVRRDLVRIAKAAREKAVEVYRARAGGTKKHSAKNPNHDVWLKQVRDDKIIYRLNRQNEAIQALAEQYKLDESCIRQLFHLIERTVPHRQIILDNAQREDCQVNLPPEMQPPPKDLLKICRRLYDRHLAEGLSPAKAIEVACSFFDEHPAYRASLEDIQETA